jgi:hypothetical protein
MLEVGLVRLAGLRSEDLLGHSDPYVIMRVSNNVTCLLSSSKVTIMKGCVAGLRSVDLLLHSDPCVILRVISNYYVLRFVTQTQ